MGKTGNIFPKSGDYFTGDDVDPKILPPTSPNLNKNETPSLSNPQFPLSKQREEFWQKQMSRIAAGNGSPFGPPPLHPKDSKISSRSTLLSPAASLEKEASKDLGAGLPPYLRFFLSPTLKRVQGNPASVWTVKVTTEKNGKVARKYQEFHMIVLWYQCLIGALGGVAVGMETEFFAANRLAQPNTLIPEKLSTLRSITQLGIQKSSSIYRLCKRAVLSGYLFDVIDKNVEEHREKQDWRNMGISGGITGAIFGLRGGIRSCCAGSLLFGAFGSLAGFQYYRIKNGKSKPGS